MNFTSYIRKPLPYSMQYFTYGIIGLNVVIFLVTLFVPALIQQMALIPRMVVEQGRWWQLLTYMFAHASFSHILFNMLALFFFGIAVERVLGSREFLLFYLVCGLGAGVLSLLWYILSGSANVYLVGASGAVYAVMLAFAVFFPRAQIYVLGIIPVRAPILVLIFTAIALFSQLSGRGENIAHFTHLAGFVFSFLYLLVRHKINAIRVFKER